MWSVNAQPAAKRKIHIWLVNYGQALMSILLCIFQVNIWIMWYPDKKPVVAPVNCTRGPPSTCCYACYLICPLCHPGGRSFFFFFYLFYLFLSFTFRNWPLVTGVQSRECCGFLKVNIWPRTERTCRRNKVRDAVFLSSQIFSDFIVYLYSTPPAFLAEIRVYWIM